MNPNNSLVGKSLQAPPKKRTDKTTMICKDVRKIIRMQSDKPENT